MIPVTYETFFTMRGATGVTIQPHQTLRLPRRKTRMLNPRHIWNVIYIARSNRCHDPTSPNTACHAKWWFSEQQVSPSTLTKYAPATQNDVPKFQRKSSKTGETSFTLRGRSEHDPRMIRPWNRQSATRQNFLFKNNVSRPGFHSKIHPVLHLPRKWRLNVTKWCTCQEKWRLNFAKYCTCHAERFTCFMKPYLHCAGQQVPQSSLTKYCACQAERPACGILITYKTSFTMCRATTLRIEPHQTLRLPGKMTLQNFRENFRA